MSVLHFWLMDDFVIQIIATFIILKLLAKKYKPTTYNHSILLMHSIENEIL